MESARLIWATLVAPLAAFGRVAQAPRALVALVVIAAAHLAVPLAVADKVDARQTVLGALGDELAEMSDREVDEAVAKAEKLVTVGMVATAVLSPAAIALALALALWLWARYLGTRPTFAVLFCLCAYAQAPLGVRSLAAAIAGAFQSHLAPAQLAALLPSSLASLADGPPALVRALGGADLFLVWTAVLLGVALVVAARMSARRAALGMGLAYLAYVGVVRVGLPGLIGA